MKTAFQVDGVGPWIEKDPHAVVDYHVAWSDWLAGDTIATATWTLATGLVKDSQSINSGALTLDGVSHGANTVATVWISGGTAGADYSVACRITTAGGRTDERTFRVVVRER